MKFQATLATLLLTATASAGGLAKRSVIIPRELQVRQSDSCPTGSKLCGFDSCIQIGYTCCPDGQGGCGPTEECQLGDNGEYGCCDAGESCTGDGGVTTTTIDDDDYGYTTTYDYDYTTSTSSRRATTTSFDDDDDTFTTTRSRSTANPSTTSDSGPVSGGITGGDIPAGSADFTHGSLSSALLFGTSAAAAALTLIAAIAL